MGKVVRLPKPVLSLLRCSNDDNIAFVALWDGSEVRWLCAECGEEIDFPHGADVAAPGPADP